MEQTVALAPAPAVEGFDRLTLLKALERKVLWLSAWMIHHANHLRPRRDGLKVGGHQASSASAVTLMTALYFDVLRPQDRVAVKPHASPVFHAIQYLLGAQSVDQLKRFRAYGGAQAYPSRTKDADDVDFSTGSVGLGVAATLFAALAQDYVRLKGFVPADRAAERPGRMIAIAGDAELDEGNVFEALLEGWKHDVRNVWWVIDYNRQSLDAIISDRLFGRIDTLFSSMGWRVVTLKYGHRLQEAFAMPGGQALREWIDACPNSLYSALVYKGGPGWREHLERDIGQHPGILHLLDTHDDGALHALMTNLAGHDMEAVRAAFHAIQDDVPTCFIAYTIKGNGLPFAGHKDNHAGLMTVEQMKLFQAAMGVPAGAEWDHFAGLDVPPAALDEFLRDVPFKALGARRHLAPRVDVPHAIAPPYRERTSTQEGFGRILSELARLEGSSGELAARIVTTSPDVTVSTNLGGWINRRGLFERAPRPDTFSDEHVRSTLRWQASQQGQHLELGIAEHNLFLLLAALGLSGPLFGARLLPIGAVYDPFIKRGLDALAYACYQDARFLLVGTPSGITLAPEGGAHQSILEPLVGMALPGLAGYEPAFVDELALLMRWAFDHLQADTGGSVYLRLSTRPVDQPMREMTPELERDIIAGAYWLHEPRPHAEAVIAACGAVLPEALAAHEALLEDVPGAGLLVVTSPDRLHADWLASRRAAHPSHIARLLGAVQRESCLVTVHDAHPAALSWLGAVHGQSIQSLGVDRFGQSGDIQHLYAAYGLDTEAILHAVARLLAESSPR